MQLLVNIDVDDLDRGIEFYTRGLDFHLGRRLFDGQAAEILGGSSRIYLLQKPAGSTIAPGASVVRDYFRHWTPVHLDIEVADVPVAVARAVDGGARLEGGIRSLQWGQLAMLSDPFGHGFCILRFSAEGYGAVAVPDDPPQPSPSG